ncbi:hypothetical protein TrRE_jg7357, partial [Triparma retinervis]
MSLPLSPSFPYIKLCLDRMYSILPANSPGYEGPLGEISSLGGFNAVLTNFQLKNRRRTSATYQEVPKDAKLEGIMKHGGNSTFQTLINLLQVQADGPAKEVYAQFAISTILRRAMGMDFFDLVDGSVASLTFHEAISICRSFASYVFSVSSSPTPLLKTSAGALAALLVRCYHIRSQLLRSSSTSAPAELAHATSTNPTIDMDNIVSFTLTLLLSSSPSPPPSTSSNYKLTSLLTLTYLPDLLATPLQGKKLSIEPVYLTSLYRQVESTPVQSLVLACCQSAPPPHYPQVFGLCERWAAVVPLTPALLKPICSLGNSAMETFGGGDETGGKQLAKAVYGFYVAAFEIEDEDEAEQKTKRMLKRQDKRRTKGGVLNPKKGGGIKRPSFSRSSATSAAVMAAAISIPHLALQVDSSPHTHPGGTAINCVTAAATTCLPVLFSSILPSPLPGWEVSLFTATVNCLTALTSSPSTETRSLVYEPLECLAREANAPPPPPP